MDSDECNCNACTDVKARQKAQSTRTVLDSLYEKLERQEKQLARVTEQLEDHARYGTRFDMNPTIHWTDEASLHMFYLDYINRIDQSVRHTAKTLLKELK